MDLLDRYRGALLGLAAGDALGTTLEFRAPGTFTPVEDVGGGGPFGLAPGQWTDDTSMALCLAESLVERGGFDPVHQLQTYCRWWQEGHLSCKGYCFDIGGTTRAALSRFLRTGDPYCGSTDPNTSGNGGIMRLAPVPLLFAPKPREAIAFAADSSRTTHASVECVDACRYFAGLIVGALQGRGKDELLSDHFSPAPGLWAEAPLTPKVATVAAGSFKRRQPRLARHSDAEIDLVQELTSEPPIRGSGYVVESLEAALWAFAKGHNFREGALLAVNLGDDADTTGAVYGQLAGAFYGASGIPTAWREKLAMHDLIESRADRLLEMAQATEPGA